MGDGIEMAGGDGANGVQMVQGCDVTLGCALVGWEGLEMVEGLGGEGILKRN